MDVIVPVKDMSEILSECLSPVLEQLRGGDTLIVIDDASSDGTAEVAIGLGARVIRIDESRGPYYARHVGAMSAESEHLLFIDGRSRALPGLVGCHRELLSRPGVALSCTETVTRSGRTLAAQISSSRQPFKLSQYIGVSNRLDYFPTCNLGVIADAYRAVGGFRNMRSGGDADLCWRVQSAGLGVLAADPRPLMEWVPRQTMSDLVEQWYRYGKSTRYLQRAWPSQQPLQSGSGRGRRIQKRVRPSLDILASIAFAAGLWRGSKEEFEPPNEF